MVETNVTRMEILELLNEGKTGQADLCEDLYVINDAFIGVVDGATNISNQKLDGKSPGRFAAEVIVAAIKQCEGDLTLDAVVEKINEALCEKYQALGVWEAFKADPSLAPKAAMALYSRYHNEVWLVGDCQCLIDGVHYQHTKIIDEITANARSLYLEAELRRGKTVEDLMAHDTGFEYVRPLIRMQYYLENVDSNHPYGFEVLNGFPIPLDMIQRVRVPSDTDWIALASDGYPVMKSNLKATEAALKQLLADDPLCIRQYKSAKGLVKGNQSFDDRTYIKFKLV